MITKGINQWSYPGGLDGTLDPAEFLGKAARDGYESAELCMDESGAFNINATQSQCEDLVALAASLKLSLRTTASGLYWGYSLGSADAADRTKAVDALKKMIQISAWLGAKTHLTITGAVDVFFLPDRPAQSYDEVLKHSTDGLKQVLPLAEGLGVRLGLENVWNKFLLSPTEISSFIDSFGSPALGAYVDVGNILPYGYPEQWLRILGPRVAAVHFKDFRRAVGTAEGFVDLLEGDVNWPAVMKALGEISYDGPVTAELIPGYKFYPEVRCQNTSRAMDAILGR